MILPSASLEITRQRAELMREKVKHLQSLKLDLPVVRDNGGSFLISGENCYNRFS
jgi:hypothetical protein